MSQVIDAAVARALKVDAARLHFRPIGSAFSSVGSLAVDGEQLYFLKSSRNKDMIHGEAESYRHIFKAVPRLCPDVIAVGEKAGGGHSSFLITTFLDFSSSGPSQISLASSLAKLHAYSSSHGFGFPVSNCCADTVQDNTWNQSWQSFFINQRLKPISQLASNAQDGELQSLVAHASETAVPHLLSSLKIKPALIHGDLWSGNARNGKIYDSCAIYAHSEFELSIMRMFGGFQHDIEEYHKLKPRDEPVQEYDDRLALYMCYHQLNHSGTGQGSSYRSSAKDTLRKLIQKYS